MRHSNHIVSVIISVVAIVLKRNAMIVLVTALIAEVIFYAVKLHGSPCGWQADRRWADVANQLMHLPAAGGLMPGMMWPEAAG